MVLLPPQSEGPQDRGLRVVCHRGRRLVQVQKIEAGRLVAITNEKLNDAGLGHLQLTAGDLIQSVNGLQDLEGILEQLRNCQDSIRMHVFRPPVVAPEFMSSYIEAVRHLWQLQGMVEPSAGACTPTESIVFEWPTRPASYRHTESMGLHGQEAASATQVSRYAIIEACSSPCWGDPSFYEHRDGYLWCRLCWKFADKKHVSTERHFWRVQDPETYLNMQIDDFRPGDHCEPFAGSSTDSPVLIQGPAVQANQAPHPCARASIPLPALEDGAAEEPREEVPYAKAPPSRSPWAS